MPYALEVHTLKKTSNFSYLLILSIYTHSDNVHDMFVALYPTSTDAQENKWSRHIRETLEVVSENECSAHATLYQDAPIDFYAYVEPKCHLGDLAYTKTGELMETINTLQIRSTNSLDHVNTVYDIIFDLPDFAWNRYMFETIDFESGEDSTDCGVRCELHSSQCDFFAYSGTKCYFGLYSQTQGTDVTVPETIRTYHKSGKIHKYTKEL